MANREIKFRLRIANKVVGYEKWYCGVEQEAKPQWLYSKDNKYWNPEYIYHKEKDSFSNLTDKNGKEIYSGDIVEWDDESDGKYWRVAIVMIDPDIQFVIVKNTRHELSAIMGTVYHWGNFAYQDTHRYLTVIGNRFENPELLKEKEDETQPERK